MFSAERLARLAGQLHDLGKCTSAFQSRLRGGPSVDHATHGARFLLDLDLSGPDRAATALAAYAIAGHHAGLPDWVGDGEASLDQRRSKALPPLLGGWREALHLQLSGLLPPTFRFDPDRVAFQLAFLGRMIFSCLVDADWRDTEAFHDRANGIERPRSWASLAEALPRYLAAYERRMETLERAASDGAVQSLRREVRRHVLSKAGDPPGLFTLTVPTGGGKTLAALGFALRHAQAHGLRRIIFVIPYTSIIEQTTDVLRGVLGEDDVLEHHSANDIPDAADEEALRDRGLDWKMALAMEDWAAPVIVTTSVQFFESLHANRPSRCRKLQAIAGAVVVIDEAQTLPRGLLRPCIETMRELAANYGASLVLCTATQPAIARSESFPEGLELGPASERRRELAPDPAGLSLQLRRVTLAHAGWLTDEELCAALAQTAQGLVIVNSRAHALLLYRAAAAQGLGGLYHLTTRQHPNDRRAILAEVRARLSAGLSCRLVATSLVEAGVDLDFPQVWRAISGLDQIAQAAGRCNREGRRPADESVVTVFRPADHKTPPVLEALALAFERTLEQHADPFGPEAMRAYFAEVYWREGHGLDEKKLLDPAEGVFKRNGQELDFRYRRCAALFKMIEDTQVPIFVPGKDEAALEALDALSDPSVRPRDPLRKLVGFTVPVFPKARDRLLAAGQVALVAEHRFGPRFCRLVEDGLYRRETGLAWEQAGELSIDASIL
jgi:CRISPR-associated endonuclease/helicase Cas3